MNTTNGKIAARSRERLARALLTVMERYDFREITVTQISQEAGLSRKTFYRLFRGKEELLGYVFEQLYEACLARIRARQLHHYWDVVQCYFDFCEERRAFLFLLKRNNLLGPLFEGAYQRAFQVFEYVRSKETVDAYSPFLPYLLAYSVGGMNSMLLKWVESNMDIPSSALIEKLKAGMMSPDI